jgi:O-antigen/teichoic acid export membrane protein
MISLTDIKGLNNFKIVRDVSASSVQTIVTQFFGFAIFYLTSKYLSKEDYGSLNWSIAVGFTLFTIASFGLDLVLVKRIASGKDVRTMSGIHLFHSICTGIILCILLYILFYLHPSLSKHFPVFFLVILYLFAANVANSFKLTLQGIEQFKKLAKIAVIVNIIKLSLILLLFFNTFFLVKYVVLVFLATALFELYLGFIYSKKAGYLILPKLTVKEYFAFIKESLPQLGVVLFDSAFARIDWILLGILSTTVFTAEYSFAFRVFELSKLPLLIVAPILLTRFSKLLGNNHSLSETNKNNLRFFFNIEIFISMLIPILLVVAWSPMVDYLTNGKYGEVNQLTFLILSICVPIHFIINFLWTLGFAKGQLKEIFKITAFVSIANIALNVLLIPLYGGVGSAAAYLICTIIQLVFYLIFINQSNINFSWKSVLLAFCNAIASVVIVKFSADDKVFIAAISAIIIYIALSIITRQIEYNSLKLHVLSLKST